MVRLRCSRTSLSCSASCTATLVIASVSELLHGSFSSQLLGLLLVHGSWPPRCGGGGGEGRPQTRARRFRAPHCSVSFPKRVSEREGGANKRNVTDKERTITRETLLTASKTSRKQGYLGWRLVRQNHCSSWQDSAVLFHLWDVKTQGSSRERRQRRRGAAAQHPQPLQACKFYHARTTTKRTQRRTSRHNNAQR